MGKFKDFWNRMVEDDQEDQYDDDEYEDEDEAEDDEQEEQEQYTSVRSENYRTADLRQPRTRAAVSDVEQRSYRRTNNIETIKPAMYSDAHKIIEKLREGNIIVFSLELVDDDLAIRILDFVYGGTFALNGTIKEVGTRVYVVTNQGIKLAEISNSSSENET